MATTINHRDYMVYLITNTVNWKSYVGITFHTLEFRFKQHCKNNRSALFDPIRKYGKEAFYKRAILNELTDEEAGHMERRLMMDIVKSRNGVEGHHGYNRTDGGEGRCNETRWLHMYSNLRTFLEYHSVRRKCCVPRNSKSADAEERLLATWWSEQRRLLLEDELPPHRRIKIEELARQMKPGWGMNREDQWILMSALVRAYARCHGKWPSSSDPDPETKRLGDWVCRQRSYRKKKEYVDRVVMCELMGELCGVPWLWEVQKERSKSSFKSYYSRFCTFVEEERQVPCESMRALASNASILAREYKDWKSAAKRGEFDEGNRRRLAIFLERTLPGHAETAAWKGFVHEN